MYTSIYQNSYIIFIITFVTLSIIFYIFKIGYSAEIRNGKIVKKFSWKYPLAISLIVWLFWYFYLYPPSDDLIMPASNSIEYSKDMIVTAEPFIAKNNKLLSQKINMTNWN